MFLAGAIILIVVYGGFAYVTSIIEESKLQSYVDMERKLQDARLLYSENCLALEENKRRYPGIIDKEKVNQAQLDNCFQIRTGDPIPVKIILKTGESIEEASTSAWTETTSQPLEQNQYVVSADKNTIGHLTVFHK